MVLQRTFDWMVLCGTKNGSSMASLEEPLEAPLRVYFHQKVFFVVHWKQNAQQHDTSHLIILHIMFNMGDI